MWRISGSGSPSQRYNAEAMKIFRATSRAILLKQMEADKEVAPYIDMIREQTPLFLEKRAHVRNKRCRHCGKLFGNHSPEEIAICSRRGVPRKP